MKPIKRTDRNNDFLAEGVSPANKCFNPNNLFFDFTFWDRRWLRKTKRYINRHSRRQKP